MKRFISTLAICLAVLSCGPARQLADTNNAAHTDPEPQEESVVYSTNTLIIMYDSKVGKQAILKAIEDYGAQVLYNYSVVPGIAITIPFGKDIQDAITYFKSIPGVISVQRDRVYHIIQHIV